MALGCPYGTHRVLEPIGVLPQAAWRLDPSPDIADNELRVAAETLNIDSASFIQIWGETGGDAASVARRIRDIVQERGKLQNPITGSGGVLIGRIEAAGNALAGRCLKPGDEIVTLVSLSLIPFQLDQVVAVRPRMHQVDVSGHAILFETGLYARIPADLPRNVVLAALDVCGAPAGTSRLIRPGQTVLILGAGGKSGLLSAAAARKGLGHSGHILALDRDAVALQRARRLGVADSYLEADATRPLEVMQAVEKALGGGGRKADLTLVCVNVPGAEMGAILSTQPAGTVYFFSMATSFTAATLGAEGIGSPVTLLMGNGYVPGHAEFTLGLMRESSVLQSLFLEADSDR